MIFKTDSCIHFGTGSYVQTCGQSPYNRNSNTITVTLECPAATLETCPDLPFLVAAAPGTANIMAVDGSSKVGENTSQDECPLTLFHTYTSNQNLVWVYPQMFYDPNQRFTTTMAFTVTRPIGLVQTLNTFAITVDCAYPTATSVPDWLQTVPGTFGLGLSTVYAASTYQTPVSQLEICPVTYSLHYHSNNAVYSGSFLTWDGADIKVNKDVLGEDEVFIRVTFPQGFTGS